MTQLPLKNYEDYLICSDGSILYPNGKISFGHERDGRYLCFHVMRDGKKFREAIHRLVAEAFIPNPENKPFVDHIDGNTKNNDVSNLRWVTGSENQANRKLNSTNTSGYQGVTYDKHTNSPKKWRAGFIRNKKLVYLGYYLTAEDANEAVVKYKSEVDAKTAK